LDDSLVLLKNCCLKWKNY